MTVLENLKRKGPVCRLEQRRVGSSIEGLARLIDFQSFDLEFSTAPRLVREVQYTHSGTVFGSTRYFYDEAGKRIRGDTV